MTLPQKLLLKPGHRAVLINEPEGYRQTLAPLPEGVEFIDAGAADANFVQLFVRNKQELSEHLVTALHGAKSNTLVWIAYPKGGAKAGTDLNRDILWAEVGHHSYTGVTLVAIDEVWSCMRFRPSDQVESIRKGG
jgi:hypothetical protein